MKIKITPEIIDKIVESYNRLQSRGLVMKELNLSRGTVRRYLLQKGIVAIDESKTGKNNKNFKDKLQPKKCIVCGNIFLRYHHKTCSIECGKKARGHKNVWNKGLTKLTSLSVLKYSINKIGKLRTDEVKINISIGTKERMHTPENWQRFISKNKNRNKDFAKNPEVYKKASRTLSKKIYSGKYTYNNIRFRSWYEVNYAKLLDNNLVEYIYEPQCFHLKTINKFYLPDFYLPRYNCYIEIKGWADKKSIEKFECFKNEYNAFAILVFKNYGDIIGTI